MILIPVMESMDSILGEMPKLIDSMEKSSCNLSEESVAFVKRLEEAAEKYRLPIATRFSVIRGKLLCSPSETVANVTRKERRAIQKKSILECLEEAYNCTDSYFADSRKIFDECERLICQVTVRLIAKGLPNKNPTGGDLIALAAKDGELAPIVIHVTGLIGTVNTNILFEKTMSLAGIYDMEV
jgi:hypothetical protein